MKYKIKAFVPKQALFIQVKDDYTLQQVISNLENWGVKKFLVEKIKELKKEKQK